MAKHKVFSLATEMEVYFCDPASPWQHRTNENTNGDSYVHTSPKAST